MANSDDLVPLIANDPGAPVGFRQGIVATWDQLTASNTVIVGGAELTNLPSLNGTEASLIRPGDVVGILVVRGSGGASTMFVLGRIVKPGTAAAASALNALGNGIAAAFDTGSVVTEDADPNFHDLGGPSVEAMIRTSGRALVFFGGQMDVSGVLSGLGAGMSFRLTGANSRGASTDWGLAFDWASAGTAVDRGHTMRGMVIHYFDDLNPGLTTFTLMYRRVRIDVPTSFADRTICVVPI